MKNNHSKGASTSSRPSAVRTIGLTTVLYAFSSLLISCGMSGFGDAIGQHSARRTTEFWLNGAVPDIDPNSEVVDMLNDVSPEMVRKNIDHLVSFGTRHTLSETDSDTHGIGAARRWIKSEFERYAAESGRTGDEKVKVYFDRHIAEPDGRRITREVEIVNVVAELPGRSPEARKRRYYVIGHYDSRASKANDFESDAPGANDDGSGVAVVMELARVMSKYHFDATIICMATAAEEQGLFGAKFHAEAARQQGLDIRAVLSNDIVGDPTDPLEPNNPKPGLVRVFSTSIPQDADDRDIAGIRALGAEADSPSRQLARYVADIGVVYNMRSNFEEPNVDLPPVVFPKVIYRTDRFLRGGDHTAFNRAGFSGIRFSEVSENYHRQHQNVRTENGEQYGDLPEFVDEDYVAGVARLNLATLAHLAKAPSAPAKARIITERLENQTTIRWGPSPESDTAGYEIVWRETTMPFWTHVVDAGHVSEYVLSVSKDNNLFGVRAYDDEGFRSPVSFAGAARK